jgi:hypothetical protein
MAIANTAPQQSNAVYGQRRKLKEHDKIDHLGQAYNGLLFNALYTTSYNDINAKSNGAALAEAPFTKQSAAYEPGRLPQHIHPSDCKIKNES